MELEDSTYTGVYNTNKMLQKDLESLSLARCSDLGALAFQSFPEPDYESLNVVHCRGGWDCTSSVRYAIKNTFHHFLTIQDVSRIFILFYQFADDP